MAEQIEAKYLKGLKYRSSASEKIKEEGRTVSRFKPVERPLKPEDVLAWKDRGDSIVIVTADGQKLTVDKDAKGKGGEGK